MKRRGNVALGRKEMGIMFSILLIVLTLFYTGCAITPQLAKPNQMVIPEPIYSNEGEFMCPYTQDGVMAAWTDKAVTASLGAKIGKMGAVYGVQKGLEQVPIPVPFVGSFLASKIGETIGRKAAIEMCGGMDYIKESADLSFNSLDDMSVYLYAKHSGHEHYAKALKATMDIYPRLQDRYHSALVVASRMTP